MDERTSNLLRQWLIFSENVIHDIISKTGSLKCHSWKFPDKLATEVDMRELLERYQFGTNELDNQVSHVVLFELVIDRLLLVLHGSWRYLHDMQTKFSPNTIDSSSTINQQTGLSIGLVVKKYWNKLLHLFIVLQQQNLRPDDRERIHRRQSKSSLTMDKHSQTIETSFSPCSSCLKLQQYFRHSTDEIINLCNTYNLPSSLAYHRCSTTNLPEWLSSDDLEQWFDCQTKDFDRLVKHLQYLHHTLNQTKTDLELSENQLKQRTEVNQRLQQTIDDHQQAKRVLQEIHDNQKKQYEQNVLKLTEQVKGLTTQKNELESQLKDQSLTRDEQMQKFESSKEQLKILTEERMKSEELRRTLEENCIRLQTELDVLKRDLDERNRDLKKNDYELKISFDKKKISNPNKRILIKSNEELTEECQSLRKQLSQFESQRDQFQRTNDRAFQEITSLKSNLEQLHQREQSDTLHRSTVDNQLRLNEQRLDILQKENQSLRCSLEKLLAANQPPVVTEERYEELRNQSRQEQSYRSYETRPKPAPLWLLNNEILEQQQQAFTEPKPANYIPRFSENDYAANGWIKPDPTAIPPRPVTASRSVPRPSQHEMIVGRGRRNVSSARSRRFSSSQTGATIKSDKQDL